MRVCLNLLAATAGGQLARARAFMKRFRRYAGDSELIVLKEKSVLTDCGAATGRTVIDVPIGLGRFKAARRMVWENLIMPSRLRANEIDVYLTFSHYLPWTFPASLPSVVGVSNLAPFSDSAWEVESRLLRLKMTGLKRTIVSSVRRADRVIALSETCRGVLLEHGISPGKIVVIPNGVDPFWWHPSGGSDVLQKHGVVRPYLLCVSHFHRYKNHPRLLEAYAMLPVGLRAMHQLVLVGQPYNRGYFDEVLAIRERLGLDRDVIVVAGENGEHLRELYQRAALFVFPSLIENSPNILLEAMAAGVPVAASSLPPMPEFGGEAAEYFDALDAHDIAARIAAILGNPASMQAMRERSARQARRFSWDDFVRRVVEQCGAVGSDATHSLAAWPRGRQSSISFDG